jgi:Gelsolin repeat
MLCDVLKYGKHLQVPFSRSSLNHDDVFILDTEMKIYQFNGANSNIQERAKALEVVQYLKDKYHDGKCDVGIVGEMSGPFGMLIFLNVLLKHFNCILLP